MLHKFCTLILFLSLVPSTLYGEAANSGVAPGFTYLDPYTLTFEKNLLKDIPTFDSKNRLNVVIEIPAGRTEKWEVSKPDGVLKWNFKKGKPRFVKYIGYPGNYGMVPKTLLPKELGGDGDPLDAIVLGPPMLRGSIANGKLIGVLKLLDDREMDDKLIAVSPNSPFYKVDSLEELDEKFPGITEILKIWFSNYKGAGKIEFKGFAGAAEAEEILKKSAEYYQTRFK